MKAIIISILTVFYLYSNAQQLPELSLRTYEPILVNPGVAGSISYPEIKLHHRSQWVGYEGAPMTSLLSYHNELNTKMGLGGYIINDKYGAYRKTALNISYAYHLNVKKVYIGLGLAANVMQYALNGNDLLLYEESDPSYAEGLSDKELKPDFSFGVYMYNRNFFLGLSVLQLLNSKIKYDINSLNSTLMPLTQHYYCIGGYSFVFDKKYVVEPSFLVSKVFGNPTQIDLNLKFEYKKNITLGMSYRYQDAVSALAGYRFGRYFIAYSYDLVTTRLRNVNSGSHEIIFSFNWPFTPDTKPLYDLKGTERGQLKKRLR